MPGIQSLPPAARFDEELVIGSYPLEEEDTTASQPVLSVERLLHGTRLTVPAPRGELVHRSPTAILRALGKRLGGWFTTDLAPHLTLHRSLASGPERESFRRGGMAISWDQPRVAFYGLAFLAGEWQVQGAGDPGAFHCVFLGRRLSQEQALGEGGHPRRRPAGPIETLLGEAAPNLQLAAFRDSAPLHAPNVFDVYLEKGQTRIKAGVRMAGDGRYFYGIRIQVED